MEDHLKRLLDTEARAQAMIDAAAAERREVIDEALAAAREAEARFVASRAGLRAPYLKDAEARAAQAVAELTRKYQERQRTLREMAARHEQEAIAAALELLLDPGH